MDCKTLHERLSAYLDDELPQAEVVAVEQHLRDCARCSAELAELRALGGVLSELEGAAVPVAFATRVAEAARLRQAAQASRRPIMLFGSARARVLIRVAAAVIAVAGLWVGISLGGAAFEDHTSAEIAQAPAVIAEESTEPGELEIQMASMSVAPPGSMAEAYMKFVRTPEVAGGQER